MTATRVVSSFALCLEGEGRAERRTGTPPRVVVLHAGLECGLIGAKYPALEMISFGPTIRGAHSPAERVDIASVETFYGLLGRTLSALAGADRAALRPND